MFVKPWCEDCEWRENPEAMRRWWRRTAPIP